MIMASLKDIILPFSDQARADSVLFDFFNICSARRIPVFLALGTALGFHRSGSYLPDDPDIDVFILCAPDVRRSLFKYLSVNGYVLNSISGASPSLNCHTVKNSILLDIWFKQRKDFSRFYHGANFISYKNRDFLIPSNIEDYLTAIYGDWRTPSNVRANCFGP